MPLRGGISIAGILASYAEAGHRHISHKPTLKEIDAIELIYY